MENDLPRAAKTSPAALAYRLVSASFRGRPWHISEMDEASFIATDSFGPAQRVWLDGSQAPQLLGDDTQEMFSVVAVNNGLLLVCRSSSWVARTGLIEWKNGHVEYPRMAVVVGNTALVSCDGYNRDGVAQVVRLDLQTGRIIDTIGKGILSSPHGIARNPDGSIVVTDYRWDTHCLQVC